MKEIVKDTTFTSVHSYITRHAHNLHAHYTVGKFGGCADTINSWQVNRARLENIVFIDEVEGVNRLIIDEAGGRFCNPTISPDTEAINNI